MEQPITTPNERRRKALLFIPLLVLPFLTLGFWALGGGGGATEGVASKGLNPELPGARLKEGKPENKLAFYDRAQRDSGRLRALRERAPISPLAQPLDTGSFPLPGTMPYHFDPAPSTTSASADTAAARVQRKLDALQAQLQAPPLVASNEREPRGAVFGRQGAVSSSPVLSRLLEGARPQEGEKTPDPEIEQLNNLMDKVLALQGGERTAQAGREAFRGQKRSVLRATTSPTPITLLLGDGRATTPLEAAFYSLPEGPVAPTLAATVERTQVLRPGATLQLRLGDPVNLQGQRLPPGLIVYGTTALRGDRLLVHVQAVPYRGDLYPVDLIGYDLDGGEGLFVPGSLTQEVGAGVAGRLTQGVELGAVDPSLRGQLARAGLEVSRGLLGKKARAGRVTVRAGYRVLLRAAGQP